MGVMRQAKSTIQEYQTWYRVHLKLSHKMDKFGKQNPINHDRINFH